MDEKEKDLSPAEESTQSEMNAVDTIEPELMDKLPPEAKKILEVGMSMHRFGPMPNPLVEKINENHIDKILDIAEKDDERSFKDARETKVFSLIYVAIIAALFVFSTVFLVGADKELYKEFIKLGAAFLGGLGGGFGIKSYLDRNR